MITGISFYIFLIIQPGILLCWNVSECGAKMMISKKTPSTFFPGTKNWNYSLDTEKIQDFNRKQQHLH